MDWMFSLRIFREKVFESCIFLVVCTNLFCSMENKIKNFKKDIDKLS